MSHCLSGAPEFCYLAHNDAPKWLVDLLINPPPWVSPIIYGVAGLAIAGAFLGYHRWGLSDTTKVTIVFNAWLVFAAATLARVLVGNGVSYGIAVAVAVVGGFLSAVALRRWCFWPLVQEHAK